mmetsp:Transcript_15244/g.46019  ORF Transcript_15244/g.46019 Transcript_15244/m.46019 type:complete len:270 (-) Transcript_15244:1534-2343(-)
MDAGAPPAAKAVLMCAPEPVYSAAALETAPDARVEPDGSPDTCRICFGEDDADNPLICPCRCNGTVKHVHVECLRAWRVMRSRTQGMWAAQVCEMCKAKYQVAMPGRLQVMGRPLPPWLELMVARLQHPHTAWGPVLEVWEQLVFLAGLWRGVTYASSSLQADIMLGRSSLQHLYSMMFPVLGQRGARQRRGLPHTLLGLSLMGACGAKVLLLSVATAYLQALRGFHSGSTNMAQRTVGGALRLALFGGTAALRLTGATAKFLLLAMLD